MARLSPGTALSSSGESGSFPVAVFPLGDLIPGQRDGIAALGKLYLEYHKIFLPEGHFADGQVEFPHTAEPLVIKLF